MLDGKIKMKSAIWRKKVTQMLFYYNFIKKIIHYKFRLKKKIKIKINLF